MGAFRTGTRVGIFVAGVVASTVSAINVATVPVGDAGNVGDAHVGGHGAVSYDFRIGKYEITQAEYTVFLNAVAGVDTYQLYPGNAPWPYGNNSIARSGGGTVASPYTYTVAADYANRPVSNVHLGDAMRFANWMHNGQPVGLQNDSTTEDGSYGIHGATGTMGVVNALRNPNATWVLPTLDEWHKAAYYKGGSVNAGYWWYPTQSDSMPGRDLADVSGNNANYFFHQGLVDPPIDSGKYGTTIVGEFQNSPGPYGTFDQAGNVWEWFEYNGSRIYPDPNSAKLGGGSYVSHDSLYTPYGFRAGSGYYSDPPYDALWKRADNGFRLAVVPEPLTGLLLSVGAAGLFFRRQRR